MMKAMVPLSYVMVLVAQLALHSGLFSTVKLAK
jgi:hypothetical protein